MGNEKENYSKLQNLYLMQLQRFKFDKFAMVEHFKIRDKEMGNNSITCY